MLELNLKKMIDEAERGLKVLYVDTDGVLRHTAMIIVGSLLFNICSCEFNVFHTFQSFDALG